MKRKKKIIIAAHCLLNCNSKVEGLSLYKGALQEIIYPLIENNYGIIQLPCPEMIIYGIKRWGHVKNQFDNPFYKEKCREMIKPILKQIEDYLNNNYKVSAVIGVEGSPSCGINKSCFAPKWGGSFSTDKTELNNNLANVEMVQEQGIFMEVIKQELEKINTKIPFYGIEENNLEKSMKIIKKNLLSS